MTRADELTINYVLFEWSYYYSQFWPIIRFRWFIVFPNRSDHINYFFLYFLSFFIFVYTPYIISSSQNRKYMTRHNCVHPLLYTCLMFVNNSRVVYTTWILKARPLPQSRSNGKAMIINIFFSLLWWYHYLFFRNLHILQYC